MVRNIEQALAKVKEELASEIEKRKKIEAERVEKEKQTLRQILEA